jgi:predicted DNA-binding protein (MmcQ/YjbR family)
MRYRLGDERLETLREEVLQYASDKYKTKPEYLWRRFPNYAVLRHADNRKWYGIIMDVPRENLGLKGSERVDIINVKISDASYVGMLIRQEGYFKGYHISRGNWVSVLLDGSVPMKDIQSLIDESFIVTSKKWKKVKERLPKEWLVPANPKHYDIAHAFDNTDEIDWKQGRGIVADDTVFIYSAAPISAILYKCKVIQTNIPYDYSKNGLTIKSLMKIKLIKRYKSDEFPFSLLKEEYGIYAVRGPRGISHSLSEALKN